MTKEHISDFLADHPTEECLAQEYIIPKVTGGKVAWFRPIVARGKIIPLWWNPEHHLYQEFGASNTERGFEKVLARYGSVISRVTGLELFSTEVAVTEQGKKVTIDYANHPIDLNSQVLSRDALPRSVLAHIAVLVIKGV